jgi:UDP:flavonoid glycosyltransferase YjiC (YdhE family)
MLVTTCDEGGVRVRILVSSWPGYGHLLAMVPLMRAAQRAGHDVLVTSGRDVAPVARGIGATFRPCGSTAGETIAALPISGSIDDLPDEEKIRTAARYVYGPGAVARAVDLLDLMADWRPDLVVHDTLELGATVAAEAYDVPHVTHGYGPMVPENAALVAAIGAVVSEADVPDPALDAFGAPYLDVSPAGLARVTPEPWKDVRPIRPSAGETDPDPGLGHEIAALPHDDTVYVTLGRVTNQAPAVFRAVLDGCARAGVNAVVTTGPGLDATSLGLESPAVLAREFLAQASVLPHCRAVISHGGAGTLLGALCQGLPQLFVPQGTDQPLNAAALVPTGAALSLAPGDVSADTVADSLRTILGDSLFASAAGAFRDEIERMPPADDVLDMLLAVPV